jgi:DNA-binding transcriptional LysR family regulator
MKIENIADLQVLVQTARTGNLTGAATAIGITPAAASATLKRLEAQLGIRLFERSTRAMRLTSQGQTLLEYAIRAFELIIEGEAQITENRSELIGIVRLATPSDLARSTLLPWLHEFLKAHPALQLFLAAGDGMLDVVRDEVDIAIRYGTPVDSRVVVRPLAATYPIVTAAPSYLARRSIPLHPRDLLEHNCLTFARGGRPHRLWSFTKNDERIEVEVRGDRFVNDASLAREWAVAGAGIILKTPTEQRAELASGTLVQVLQDWETEVYPLNAVLPSGRFIPIRVRALMDFLVAKFELHERASAPR